MNKRWRFIKTHYRFFILLAGISAMIVLQILSRLSQQKQTHLLETILEAEVSGTALVIERLMDIQGGLEKIKLAEGNTRGGAITATLTGQQVRLLETILEAEISGTALIVKRLAEMKEEALAGDTGEIIVMLTEQMVNNYTEKALEYFREADYVNAARDFSRALRYRRRNTTLMFYHVYALYLGQQNRTLTPDELAYMQTGIRELQERGFREEEKLGFSVAEMEQKAQEMGYNIGERR